MQLHELLAAARRRSRALDAAVVHGDDRVDVAAVVCDSRAVTPGALFCAVPGRTVDGHDFARIARNAGAAALLVERVLDVDVPQVVVPSSAAATGPLASAVFGDPSDEIAVFGVTGTNGKTTTTYLFEGIARAAGDPTGVIGTVETRYGDHVEHGDHTTPDACALQALLARMRDAGVATIAMEVSSHALDQHRVDGTAFAVACFTNLSQDHLDYHGTMAAYGEAKARLFDPSFTPRAAINVDDAFGRDLAERAVRRGVVVLTYGLAPDAAVSAHDLRSDATGTRAVLAVRDRGEVELEVPLAGTFNVANALGAAASAVLVGYDLAVIALGIAATRRVPGRLEPIADERGRTVFVDYAHTPDALARVLATVRPLAAPGGKVVVVFGCGGDRDPDKRPQMGAAAEAGADVVVVTSDNPRSEDPAEIAAAALSGMRDRDGAIVDLDRRRAIAQALHLAAPGDVVVIAGKGHEPGQTANGVTAPFDDREVTRELLAACGRGGATRG